MSTPLTKIGGVFLKKELTVYGKRVKKKLIDIDRTQTWLIEKIKEELPTCYVDGSLLNKIFVGDVVESNIIPVINKILSL